MKVALFTRAWIEIYYGNFLDYAPYVALFTRAWIEIVPFTMTVEKALSPSSRGRGLK